MMSALVVPLSWIVPGALLQFPPRSNCRLDNHLTGQSFDPQVDARKIISKTRLGAGFRACFLPVSSACFSARMFFPISLISVSRHDNIGGLIFCANTAFPTARLSVHLGSRFTSSRAIRSAGLTTRFLRLSGYSQKAGPKSVRNTHKKASIRRMSFSLTRLFGRQLALMALRSRRRRSGERSGANGRNGTGIGGVMR
jgi:hypothetical protein